MTKITSQNKFEEFLDELYAETTSPTVQIYKASLAEWNQIYVIVDQAEHYHVAKGVVTLEIRHSRGILVAINTDFY